MHTQLRHPFRWWIEQQEIAEPALALFDEGMICYAAGAYRAAVVFSYLGILRAVAHKLMVAQRPSEFPENFWGELQRKVREDGTWEGTIFDAMMMERPASIFLIDDDLRQQLRYWRGRRNDAAHARTNEIDAPHVEALWLFAKSNLPRLIVAGSRAGLHERFRRHFDPSYTQPGADFAHLVTEIPVALRAVEYTDFLRDIFTLTYDAGEESGEYPDMSSEGGNLVEHILGLNNEKLSWSLTGFLDSDQRLLLGAILRVPRLTTHYYGRGSFIRKLWHDLLPFQKQHWFDPINRSLGVVAFMLRNGMIPESQRDEAFKHIIEKIHEGYFHSDYTDEVMDALTPHGFWEAVRQYGFGWGNPQWVAKNLSLAVEYLARYPVDRQVASSFAQLVPPGTNLDDGYLHGSNFYEPEDAFNLRVGYFYKNPHKLEEIVRVARENDIDISRFEYLMRPSRWIGEPSGGGASAEALADGDAITEVRSDAASGPPEKE
jgi:hypothetical protein